MKRFLIIFVLFLCNVLVNAKPVQRPTSYNYQRGVEAYVNEKDHQKALDYLNKELEEQMEAPMVELEKQL